MGAVGKLLSILKELKLSIIGVVENMKMADSDYIKDSVSKMKIRYLGYILFDKKLEDSIGNPSKLQGTDFMKDLENVLGKIV